MVSDFSAELDRLSMTFSAFSFANVRQDAKGNFFPVPRRREAALEDPKTPSPSHLTHPLLRFARKSRALVEKSPISFVLSWTVADSLARGLYKLNARHLPATEYDSETSSIIQIEDTHLIVADSFWGRTEKQFEQLIRLPESGVRLWLLIHDIIPISHPEFVSSGFAQVFKKRIELLSGAATHLVFVSQTSLEAFTNLFPDLAEKSLGVVYPAFHASPEFTAAKSRHVTKRPKSLLAVGTIDRRKNYGVLLRWFEEYGVDEYQLTIIGRSNGTSPHLVKQMMRLRDMYPNFRWLEDADDSVLWKEVLAAQYGVSASIVEGFGLPTVEMAMGGCRLILSDIPVNREVGGKLATYFDPFSPSDLQRAITSSHLQNGTLDIPTLSQSCRNLLEKIGVGLSEL